MNHTYRFTLGGLLILFLSTNLPLVTAAVVFNDQGSFLSAAGPLSREDFEDEPLVGNPDSGAVPSIAFDFFTATSTPTALKVLGSPAFGNHNTTPGGQKYLSADTDLGFTGSTVQFISFAAPVSTFGLFLVDIESGATVTINAIPYNVASTGDGGTRYFGIIEDVPFTSVALSGGQDSHWSMDDVVANVPEPPALLLSVVAACLWSPRAARG